MHSWESTGRATQPALPPSTTAATAAPTAATAATAATAKGINTAAAAVATAYNDKCKPAHEVAVHASQAVQDVRSALTAYLRQGSGAHGRSPDLASLGAAELKIAGGSYRYIAVDR